MPPKRPTAAPGPALGLVELASIARGIATCDAMVKRAAVKVLAARPASPGKYLVLVAGGEAEVEEAMQAGLARAAGALLDSLYLAQADAQIPRALDAVAGDAPVDSLAVVELATVCAALLAADAAVKAAQVRLRTLRLADGLGGKGYFTLVGGLPDVEAAVEAARAAAGEGRIVSTEIIAAPHGDLPGGAF